MALDMAVGMAVWMAVRRHGLRMIGEMTLAMVAPFLLLLPWIERRSLVGAGHVLMLVAMVALMLVRWEHYSATPTWAFGSRRGDVVESSGDDAPSHTREFTRSDPRKSRTHGSGADTTHD